jgi:phytoene desaturase
MSNARSVVVIGGGVSGLAAGIYLARRGWQVTIYEANDKVGGSCGSTIQDGYVFSDGALWLVGLGLLDYAFEQLELDRPSRLPLQKITATMTTRLRNGGMVTLHDGRQLSLEKAGSPVDTGHIQRELDQLLKRWLPVYQLLFDDLMRHPYSTWRLLRKSLFHLPKFGQTVTAEMNRLFSNEEMRSAMSGALLYTGLAPEETPAVQIVGLAAMLTEGYYLPEGGLGSIPDALAGAFKEFGGELVLNADVKNIIVKNGRVQGIKVNGHGVVEAQAVISTVSAMITFGSLMDPADVPVDILKMVEVAPLSASTFFCVQLGLANQIDVRSQLNFALPMMEEQYRLVNPDPQDCDLLFYSVPTVTLPALAPPGGSVVEIFAATRKDDLAGNWDEERKERTAKSVIEALSRLHDINMVTKRVRCPRDFETGLHLYQGRIYGLSPATNLGAYFPYESGVPGLYLAGQTTHPGYGIAPSTMSGILVAQALAGN